MTDDTTPTANGSPPADRTTPSRRDVLRATGAAGVLASTGLLSGAAGAQQRETIRLDGRIDAWIGREPADIEGERNPTLELEPGTDYRVVWENVDGVDHNFVITDAAGDQLIRSEVIGELGATQTVDFTATTDMTTYFCEVHPATMRGPVDAGGRETPAVPDERQIPREGTVGLREVASGLTAPLGMEVGDETRYVVDQTGQIYSLDDSDLSDPFLDVSDRMVDLGVSRLRGYDERGLLGLAFHPDYADNGRFFVRYSAPLGEDDPEDYNHAEVLSEFRATDDRSSADPESERRLLELPSPQMNHDGGAVAFGPDGLLYVALGDGGAADDVGPGHVDDWYDRNRGGNGQDVESNLWGSILRLDVDPPEGEGQTQAEAPVGVPAENPLVDDLSFPLNLQYAWGFRNPWRMSFNDGALFVGDAQQNLWEEVNVVTRGGNYGWNVKEGTHCFSTENPTEVPRDCPDSTPMNVRGGEPLLDPIIEYRHRESTTAFIDGSVVIGGYVYDNQTVPSLTGSYVFGNWSGEGVIEPEGEIFVASPPGDADLDSAVQRATNDRPNDHDLWDVRKLRIAGAPDGRLDRYVLGFGRDDDGELYVLTSGNFRPRGDTGVVYKLVAPEQGETVTPSEAETETPADETPAETEAETGTATETETGTPAGNGTETATGTEPPTDTASPGTETSTPGENGTATPGGNGTSTPGNGTGTPDG